MYEELINLLRRCGEQKCKNCEYEHVLGCVTKMNERAADAIEALSKTEKTTRWIPVTERLPERSGTYLVYVYGDVTDLNYWRGEWHRLGDDYTKAVTHWMPLPEPPEEE